MNLSNRSTYFFKLFTLILILIVVCFFSLIKGSSDIGFNELMGYFTNSINEETSTIIKDVRISRTLIALFSGSGLAVSGMILQSVFRNNLADPFIVGISGGASLGAAIAIISGFSFSFMGFDSTPLFSFVFSLACVFLSYKISISYGKINVERLLLSGVAISSLCSSLLSGILSIKGEDATYILAWLMGNIAGKSFDSIKILLPYFLISNLICIFYLNKLNIIELGEETTENLGFDINKLRLVFIFIASILSASIVSIIGIIGFVGLIAPQIARYFIKTSDYRLLYPIIFVLGSIILVSSDLLARSVISPQELPVGIFTSLLGVPFFVFLLIKNTKKSL